MTLDMNDLPNGFKPLFRTSPHLDNLGDFYYQGSGESMVILVKVLDKNANARGTAHGGFLSSLADISLGYAAATESDPPQKLVTTSMTLDYAGGVSVGDWVESKVDVQKVGKRVAFANCYLSVNGTRIVRASAVFQNYGDIIK